MLPYAIAYIRKQDADGDGTLRPRCRHLANLTKHTLSVILAP